MLNAFIAFVSLFLTVWTWWEKKTDKKSVETKAIHDKINEANDANAIVRLLNKLRG